jgi:acylpyruvate hydrolase
MSLISRCRKLVCVGRNFGAHAKELGNPLPSKPFFFIKPSTSLLAQGQGPILIPPQEKELHHEVELGVVIGKRATDVSRSDWESYVSGYVVALDMTGRTLQNEAKKSALPWSIAKGADTFCPVGSFLPKSAIKDPQNVELWLKVNGENRQHGNTNDQIFSIPVLLEFVTQFITLEEGDILLTGTPEGVGPVKAGDVITAGISGLEQSNIKFSVADRKPKAKL